MSQASDCPAALQDPLTKTRDDFEQLIAQISVANSPVGIDAQYTHAIIIDFLRQISARLDRLEQRPQNTTTTS